MSVPIGSVGWPGGAKAAISLTYDGGLSDHLLLVEPLLRVLGLKATFYVSATLFLEHSAAWCAMAQQGHEIGNHSLYGVTGPHGELPNWTLEMVDSDLQMTESLLRDYVPGPSERSFAYPGELPFTAEGSYEPVVQEHFCWARTSQEGFNHSLFCNPQALRSTPAKGAAAQMVQKAEEAIDLGAWAIFVFEGLRSRDETRGERDHELLLRHLALLGSDVHVAPVREIARFIASVRAQMTVR